MTTLQKLEAEVIETVNGMGAVVFAALISRFKIYARDNQDDADEKDWRIEHRKYNDLYGFSSRD